MGIYILWITVIDFLYFVSLREKNSLMADFALYLCLLSVINVLKNKRGN